MFMYRFIYVHTYITNVIRASTHIYQYLDDIFNSIYTYSTNTHISHPLFSILLKQHKSGLLWLQIHHRIIKCLKFVDINLGNK